jgi:hypothetical protein
MGSGLILNGGASCTKSECELEAPTLMAQLLRKVCTIAFHGDGEQRFVTADEEVRFGDAFVGGGERHSGHADWRFACGSCGLPAETRARW